MPCSSSPCGPAREPVPDEPVLELNQAEIAAEQADYAAWKPAAVAELTNRHEVNQSLRRISHLRAHFQRLDRLGGFLSSSLVASSAAWTTRRALWRGLSL
jgi:hypothetical protein